MAKRSSAQSRAMILIDYVLANPWSTKQEIMEALHWTSSQFLAAKNAVKARAEAGDPAISGLAWIVTPRYPYRYALTDNAVAVLMNVVKDTHYGWTKVYRGPERLLHWMVRCGGGDGLSRGKNALRIAEKARFAFEDLARMFAEDAGIPAEILESWFIPTREESF